MIVKDSPFMLGLQSKAAVRLVINPSLVGMSTLVIT